jgi:hypothetical protein
MFNLFKYVLKSSTAYIRRFADSRILQICWSDSRFWPIHDHEDLYSCGEVLCTQLLLCLTNEGFFAVTYATKSSFITLKNWEIDQW